MDINTNKGLFRIRPIAPEDNRVLTDIIINSLLEFGASGEGFACSDPETLERMDAARALYEKYNFRQIKSPLGATGHFSCDAFYIREL